MVFGVIQIIVRTCLDLFRFYIYYFMCGETDDTIIGPTSDYSFIINWAGGARTYTAGRVHPCP